MTGIEPVTSSLPRKRSTPELHRQPQGLSGKRGSNSRPQPWKGCALPTELFPPAISLEYCISAAKLFRTIVGRGGLFRTFGPSRARLRLGSNLQRLLPPITLHHVIVHRGERRIRTSEVLRQQIYSLPQLTALVSPRYPFHAYRN